KTTDNFWQDHNLLTASVNLSERWKMAGTLHYTYGYGYYDEFRSDNKLSKFGLPEFVKSDGETLSKTDFVRRKGLEQHTYGIVWNINYSDSHWEVVGGLSMQNFEGNHFGRITYIADSELAETYLAGGDYKYYDSDATKTDGNVFAKATYRINRQWSVFADMQYRHVNYVTTGINDKFYSVGDGYENQRLDINKKYDFFNPKAGVNWQHAGHRAYVSVAVSHREPERNNFTDNGSYAAPKAEQLTDLEVGYSYTGSCWNASIGGYYMKYKNQFVQTGELSDIGENLTTNIKDSYRMGIELAADYSPWRWLNVAGNAALSKNKIKDFDEHVEDWDNGEQIIHYDNSTLSFSPTAILNGFVTFNYKGLQAAWHTNFVSRQYLDNSASKDRSLPAYSQSDLCASYGFKVKKVGSITVGANLNNVFNRHYAASGWVYSAIYESGGHTNDNRYREIGYIPMAGRNVMANVTIRLF
ncbi:MAG: TonB-dependent receptor, partial [Prevotella sp.]|nr:TonB-dependent receptor [Prevotella sp.]